MRAAQIMYSHSHFWAKVASAENFSAFNRKKSLAIHGQEQTRKSQWRRPHFSPFIFSVLQGILIKWSCSKSYKSYKMTYFFLVVECSYEPRFAIAKMSVTLYFCQVLAGFSTLNFFCAATACTPAWRCN